MTYPTLEDRVTILETRFDTVLPNLATKADIAEIKTEMARLEGKMDAIGNRLILQFAGIAIGVAGITFAAVKFL